MPSSIWKPSTAQYARRHMTAASTEHDAVDERPRSGRLAARRPSRRCRRRRWRRRAGRRGSRRRDGARPLAGRQRLEAARAASSLAARAGVASGHRGRPPGGCPRRPRRGRLRPLRLVPRVGGSPRTLRSARRLRLRCPNGDPSRAQRSRRPRVVGLGDRPHDDDPPSRRASTAAGTFAASSPPIANHGLRDGARARTRRTPAPRPGGRAWSASRAPGRPRGSRRRRRRRAASACAGAWVERPTIRSGPTTRARRAGVPSSWPTCTPSAPHASTRSGRSLRMNSAPCASAAARNARAAATSASSSSVLSRSWIRSTPPRSAASRNAARAGVADEVQAGGRRSLAWGHATSRAATMDVQNTGARESG